MPRPFIVEIYIEEGAFGSVVRKLDNMEGVISINWDADKDRGGKSKPNGTGPRPTFDRSGKDALLDIIFKAGKPVTTGQLREAFEAEGRKPSSTGSLLFTAKNLGDVIRTEDGYTLSKKARDRLSKRKRK